MAVRRVSAYDPESKLPRSTYALGEVELGDREAQRGIGRQRKRVGHRQTGGHGIVAIERRVRVSGQYGEGAAHA